MSKAGLSFITQQSLPGAWRPPQRHRSDLPEGGHHPDPPAPVGAEGLPPSPCPRPGFHLSRNRACPELGGPRSATDPICLKEATIRTLLRRLEQKGYLLHHVQGRAFIYHATEPARSLAARAVRQIIDRLCQGSVEELVSGMVDANVLSNRELDRLAEVVRRRREGG